MIPLRTQGGFKTNAAGNGLDNRIIATGHWAAVYASCQCNGNGQWVAGPQGDADFFQQGANVVLGPFILRPGDHAEVAVVGANADADASIVYHGWLSDEPDGSDLAQVSTTPLTAGSLSGSAALSLTGNVPVVNATNTLLGTNQEQVAVVGGNPWNIDTATPGGVAMITLTLPTINGVVGQGVHAVSFGFGGAAVNAYQSLTVEGHQTTVEYAVISGIFGSRLLIIPIESVYDTSLDVSVAYTVGSGTLKVWVAAILDTLAVQVDAPEVLPVVPFDTTNGNQVTWDSVGQNVSQMVSLLGATPAPWQAPNLPPIRINQAVTAGNANRIVVKTGVANKLIYLHSAVLTSDQALAGGIVLWDGDANAGGTARDIFSEVGIGTTGEIAPNNLHLYRGAPLGTTTGNMLSLTVDANATVRGYVALSQA